MKIPLMISKFTAVILCPKRLARRSTPETLAPELNEVEQFQTAVGDVIAIDPRHVFEREIGGDVRDAGMPMVVAHLQQELYHVQFRSEVVGGIWLSAQFVNEQAAVSVVKLRQCRLPVGCIEVGKFACRLPVSAQPVVAPPHLAGAVMQPNQIFAQREQGHGLAATQRAVEKQALVEVQPERVYFAVFPHPGENAVENAFVSFLNVEVRFDFKHRLTEKPCFLVIVNFHHRLGGLSPLIRDLALRRPHDYVL